MAAHHGSQHHLFLIGRRLATLTMHHGNPEIEMAVIRADDQLVGLDREYREKIDMRSALCDQFCAHLSGGLDPEGPDHKIPTGQQPSEPARRPRQYLMSQSIDISRRIRRQGDGESIRKLGGREEVHDPAFIG